MRPLVVALAAVFMLGCGRSHPEFERAVTKAPTEPVAVVERIGLDEARRLYDDASGKPDFTVLDVRSREEFRRGRIPGAVNLSIHEPDFEGRLAVLPRNHTYLVHCTAGVRSLRAMRLMKRLGFTRVYEIPDGIAGWAEAGHPTER